MQINHFDLSFDMLESAQLSACILRKELLQYQHMYTCLLKIYSGFVRMKIIVKNSNDIERTLFFDTPYSFTKYLSGITNFSRSTIWCVIWT